MRAWTVSCATRPETFFATLTKRRLRRRVLRSIIDLQAAIHRYITEYNTEPKPFVWTADPDRVLAAINRGKQAWESVPCPETRLDEARVGPILPLAGTWRTWRIASGDALRPPPPPAPDSAQKISELAEIKAVQRSPAMTSQAWFWEWGAGGTRAWSFWNEQTSRKVLEYGLSDKPPEAARAFALASMAVHDAVVACWDAKYAYWAMRPFQVDPELKPLFPAPNHPSYPAAHACISTAAGYTLAGLFPRDAESLRSLAKQAGDARMWAGIHFRSDVEAGRAIGDAVAALAIPHGLLVPVR